MNWTHKNIKIEITSSGKFAFKCCNTEYLADSLDQAKEIINVTTKVYYTISINFYSHMLDKLDNKEKMFLNQLVEELRCHEDNPYCELCIRNRLDFEIDKQVFDFVENDEISDKDIEN